MYKDPTDRLKRRQKDRDNKVKRKEGNSNTSSKRLTMPPAFLSLGVVLKENNKGNSNGSDSFEEKEGLYGIFNNCISIAEDIGHSTRIYEKNSDIKGTKEPKYNSASFPYSTSRRERKIISKSKSRSLFQEITKRYAELESNNSLSFFIEQVEQHSVSKHFVKSEFCNKFYQQICINLETNLLMDCKKRIREKMETIDFILSGEPNMFQKSNKQPVLNKNVSGKESEENVHFEYFPPSEWVFETPPRQKIAPQKLDECNIQPAVIYTNKNKSDLYEFRRNSKMDMTQYVNRKNLDGRYMKRIASWDKKNEVEEGVKFLESKGCNASSFFSHFQLNPCQDNDGQLCNTSFSFI